MLAVVSIACLLSLSHVLAYSRIFQSDADDFPFDPLYEWRAKKEQRNADLEAYLRQMMLQVPGGRPHGWPPEMAPVHRPPPELLHRPPFHYAQSDFAVPPSDSRFFDPPVRPHLYYNREEVSGPRADEEDWSTAQAQERATEEKRVAESTTTSVVVEENEEVVKTPIIDFSADQDNILLIAVVAGSSTAAIVGVALLIYGYVRYQKKAKDAADVEYPAYGVTGPNKESTPTGDRRLAHSAQMYHYQLTKQQIIAMESSNRGERRGSVSEADSEDDENEEGDYTVYECPGLAPTGEMEVKNPLFQDETTPANNDQSKE